MSSRLAATRGGGKSLLQSVSRSTKKTPVLQQSLFPSVPTISTVPLALRLSSPLHKALLSLPKQTRRSFSTFQMIRDVILQRPNPVTAALRQEHVQLMNDIEGEPNGVHSERKPILNIPEFSAMRSSHFEPAARQVQEAYEQALSDFEKKMLSSASTEYTDVVPVLDRIEAPIRALSQILHLLHNLQQDPSAKVALEAASRQLNPHHKTSTVIMKALRGIEAYLSKQNEKASECERRHLWAVQFLLSEYENMGLNLDGGERTELESIRSSLANIEGKFAKTGDCVNIKKTSTREKLEDIYSLLSLRSKEAKIMGFATYADAAFQSKRRMASSVEEVRMIHKEVVSRVRPAISSGFSSSFEEDSNLLSYLTLDGVLGGVFGLSRALFGVVVLEENDAEGINGWHPDLRLFHVFDESSNRYFGSFYLDAYRRQLKTEQAFVASIFNKCGSSLFPLVCLSCNIRPPVWDHLPTAVTLDDARSVFHEFGHVLQCLLCQEKEGGVFGAHNLELDAGEMLSQFMEHWLFQESVLQSLAKLSQADKAIPRETMDKVMEQRSHEKAHEIMHRVFLSELEFELFSGLEDESVVSVLKRIAKNYRAHDPLHKSDIWPLLEVFGDSIGGEHVTTYRYMWSEVMSADLFRVFDNAGIANEQEIKRLGRLFREIFLDHGASVDTKEGFRKFCGRDMSPDALFDMYGY